MTCLTSQISWNEVLARTTGFPTLVREALGSLGGGSDVKGFFTASYPYGQLIVDKGEFRTPCDPGACERCRDLFEATAYSSIPLVGILKGSAEVFVDAANREEVQRVIPLKLSREGEFFGTFETLDYLLKVPSPGGDWSVSSGARSIWIIAPLGDVRLTQFLREESNGDIDWTETDPHWRLVESVTKKTEPWHSEMLIFPKSVIKSVRRSTEFFNLLLELGWKQSSRLRDSSTEDSEMLRAADQILRKIRAPQGQLYHFRTIRHLQEMFRGVVPVFQSSNRTTPAGPFRPFIDCLRRAICQAKSQSKPVVLQPGHLEKPGEIGYYSFRCPSVPGPGLPETNFAFSEIAEVYRDILLRLRKSQPEWFGSNETRFFVRPSANAKIPLGLVSVRELPADDFYGADSPTIEIGGLYAGSPFLVAGMRISRTGNQAQLGPSENIRTQARAAGKAL